MVALINKTGRIPDCHKGRGRPMKGLVPYAEKYCRRTRLSEEGYRFLKLFVAKSSQTSMVGALDYILTVVRTTKEVREALGITEEEGV
jgi:hypothetical protein